MLRGFRVASFASILSASLLDAVLLDHDGKKPAKNSLSVDHELKKPAKQSLLDSEGDVKKPEAAMNIGFRHFDENKDGKMSRYEYAFALLNMTRAELDLEEDKKAKLEKKEMRTKRCEAENKRSKTEKKSKTAEAEHKVWQLKLKNASEKKQRADTNLNVARVNVKETLKANESSSLAQYEEEKKNTSEKKEEQPETKFVAQCSEQEMEGATVLKVEEHTAEVQVAGMRVQALEGKVKEVLDLWAVEKVHHHQESLNRADDEHKQTKVDLDKKAVKAKEAEKALKEKNEAVEKLR